MKNFTTKLSTLILIGIALNGCVVYRTAPQPVVYSAPAPVQVIEPEYVPQPNVVVEENDYYRANEGEFSYYYCPEQDFYYSPDSYYFWWNEGGNWRSGYELPYTYTIHSSTTYVTVIERDNNPTRYNHNHRNYYNEGRYRQQTHRVGDDDRFRLERDAKNNYYRPRNNKQGGTSTNYDRNVRPANDRNNENPRGGFGNNNHPAAPGTQVGTPNHGQGKDKGNNGRFNEGNPKREVKPEHGTPAGPRQNSPAQGDGKGKGQYNNPQPNQGIQVGEPHPRQLEQNDKTNNGRFNQGSPKREVNPEQATPVGPRQNPSTQGEGKGQNRNKTSQPNQGGQVAPQAPAQGNGNGNANRQTRSEQVDPKAQPAPEKVAPSNNKPSYRQNNSQPANGNSKAEDRSRR